MEITSIKRNGSVVNVIFTGEQYIFHNAYYGILAVAQRKGFKKEKGSKKKIPTTSLSITVTIRH